MQNFYDNHSQEYFDSTIAVDMSHLYALVLPYLKPGARVLDLGCGSGRDSIFFASQGFELTAVEPSKQMARLAEAHSGLQIMNLRAQDLDYEDSFDLIWACASLLHVPLLEMPLVWQKIARALTAQGIAFISLKKGDFEGIRAGRYYCDYNQDRLLRSGYPEAGLRLIHSSESHDARPGRETEIWGNYVLNLE